MVETTPARIQVQTELQHILEIIKSSHYKEYLKILNKQLIPYLIELEKHNLLIHVDNILTDFLQTFNQFVETEIKLIISFLKNISLR